MTHPTIGTVAMGDTEAAIRSAGLKARDELLERLADGGTVDNDLADYMSKIVNECVRAALLRPAEEPASVVRHKKRGSEYEVIGIGKMQAESWIDEAKPAPVDMRKVAVYRSTDDGLIWVRPLEEFEDGRFEPVAAALSSRPAQEAVAIVPPYCSGSALSFDPGVLHVSKDGSGYIAINEDDFVLEDDRCEGPDGPEGSVHWITRMDASELVALRDFLNGNAVAAPQPVLSQPGVKAEAVWGEILKKISWIKVDPSSRVFTDSWAQNEVIGFKRAEDIVAIIRSALCPLSDIPAQAEPGKAELLELLAHFDRLGIKNRAAYERAIQDLRSAICFPASEGSTE